ncbi:hypothetical protein Hanom_Chr14g01259441 [Helianthus anomalus]
MPGWARPVVSFCLLVFALGDATEGSGMSLVPSSCIYVGFGCLFAPFVLLRLFDPVNSKGRKKRAFSNISTEKWLVLCLVCFNLYVAFCTHHISY